MDVMGECCAAAVVNQSQVRQIEPNMNGASHVKRICLNTSSNPTATSEDWEGY